MPKRKRGEDELEEKLVFHRAELWRQIKAAKGFERQRMAKRQRDPKSTAEKRARIDKEIAVLKSLDLQSVAHAHLCASLLKIKAVAESPKLLESVKNGVPKPEITEEERIALHNVTSGLYNQPKVRDALDKALADICRTLNVPVPDKKSKLKKDDKKAESSARKDPEEQLADKTTKREPEAKIEKKARREVVEDGSENEEGEWNGFSDDDDDDDIEKKEEQAIARFDDRLGSSDEDEYDTANEELDPMEITDLSASEESEDEDSLNGSELEDESRASEEEDDSEDEASDSSAVSPPPKARKNSKKTASSTSKGTQFLPTLMGGYISGSESEASDIDVAPATQKNRRGQRARQAIWEKKFKDKAKHLAKQQAERDAGWDLKRGAVDGSERTPWKKGIRTPFEKKAGQPKQQEQQYQEPRRPKAPPKKDDEGPLHPSWEAKKKAKEAQQTAAFAGKRVVFD